MKHYPHHIGDFDKATRHLTRIERSVYRDLIDLYCETEKPIPLETHPVSIRLQVDIQTIQSVLAEFFTKTPSGWWSDVCSQKIEDYYRAKKDHWGWGLTKGQRCAYQAARNAMKARATPGWLSADQKKAIVAVYAKSEAVTAQTGIPHEVDHIIPLRGAKVCGLHVAWNLQILEASENRRKSNHFEPV